MKTPFSVKNLIIFRLTREIDFSRLPELSQAYKFTPCGAQDISKTGWISPMGDEYENLIHQKSGVILLCVKTEKKNIPASVIKERLDDKVKKLEEEQKRKLKRTEIASLKDEILQELLPVTLPKATRTLMWIDTQAGLIIVDASSARRAEDVNALLRKTIGSLPVVPVTMEKPVELTLTEWVRSGDLPAGVHLGSDATLKAV
ncbi:recombination-associated protein RdgC, partial [Cronobacter dublinensis subsp. dublinensis]|nr:recombination-associated protein RdgC [Cronobacter dublinensis subsp. dublinensis]